MSWPARRSGPLPIGQARASSVRDRKEAHRFASTATPAIPTGVAFTIRSASSAASTVADQAGSAGQFGHLERLLGPSGDDFDALRPGGAQRQHDCARRTTSAKDQATLPVRGPSQLRQRVDKTRAVRAVADQLASPRW